MGCSAQKQTPAAQSLLTLSFHNVYKTSKIQSASHDAVPAFYKPLHFNKQKQFFLFMNNF
jgi:hypothetical protein